MSELLDDTYLEWLYSSVSTPGRRSKSRSHWQLLHHLHGIPFIWFVPNDDNRALDGIELRFKFLDECAIEDVDRGWLDLDCSFLEMLIALAGRAAFQSDEKISDWFWKLIENLDLLDVIDRKYTDEAKDKIDISVRWVLERTYLRNGAGGLFPLRNPRRDQRKVEIWYQMSSYLLEGGLNNDDP